MAVNFGKIVKQCRIDKPGHFKLADHDPAETFGLSTDIEDVRPILAEGTTKLEDMQQRLFANGEWAVLLVFQGMDAAGKDSVVKHVMSGVNPQGCEVHSFKAPSAEEIGHDFLWRVEKNTARARAYRHFQPLALRGRSGRARAPGALAAAEAAAAPDRQGHLETPLQGYPRL